MDHHLTGPWLGNVIILVIGGLVTVGCYLAAIWMLLRPGERDPRHPKYYVVNDGTGETQDR